MSVQANSNLFILFRFDEDLSRAIKMNVGAVKAVASLARKMKKLVSLVHVSTAYCHCNQQNIKV